MTLTSDEVLIFKEAVLIHIYGNCPEEREPD